MAYRCVDYYLPLKSTGTRPFPMFRKKFFKHASLPFYTFCPNWSDSQISIIHQPMCWFFNFVFFKPAWSSTFYETPVWFLPTKVFKNQKHWDTDCVVSCNKTLTICRVFHSGTRAPWHIHPPQLWIPHYTSTRHQVGGVVHATVSVVSTTYMVNSTFPYTYIRIAPVPKVNNFLQLIFFQSLISILW